MEVSEKIAQKCDINWMLFPKLISHDTHSFSLIYKTLPFGLDSWKNLNVGSVQ